MTLFSLSWHIFNTHYKLHKAPRYIPFPLFFVVNSTKTTHVLTIWLISCTIIMHSTFA